MLEKCLIVNQIYVNYKIMGYGSLYYMTQSRNWNFLNSNILKIMKNYVKIF